MAVSYSTETSPSTFTRGSERIAFKVAKVQAKKDGKSEVGIDIISILAALLTTLLPTLLEMCQKDAKSLVASARKPGLGESLWFRTRSIDFLRRKGGMSVFKAVVLTEQFVEFGKSKDFTEEDAEDYLAE